MRNNYDIREFVDVITIDYIKIELVNRFIKRRKEAKLSQKELAKRSGVSYGSIRRFESTGDISLHSLFLLSQEIDCLKDFVTAVQESLGVKVDGIIIKQKSVECSHFEASLPCQNGHKLFAIL